MREPPSIEHSSPGTLARWRRRVSENKRRRLLRMSNRQRLAASLRQAATCRPIRSRHTVLLHDRVALVRDQLLELALMLEHGGNLDGSWVLAVHRLLTDGCESPLYNPDVHISELRATLYYLLEARRIQAVPLD
jgi:hypothetical protein